MVTHDVAAQPTQKGSIRWCSRITCPVRGPGAVSRWLSSQQNYARKEADFLLSLPKGAATFSQRLRLIGCVTPVLVFFYTLIVKRCLLDGWPGCLYVLQRTLAETMIALEIIDRRLRGRGPNKAAGLGGRLQPLDPIAQQNGTDAKHEAEQS